MIAKSVVLNTVSKASGNRKLKNHQIFCLVSNGGSLMGDETKLYSLRPQTVAS